MCCGRPFWRLVTTSLALASSTRLRKHEGGPDSAAARRNDRGHEMAITDIAAYAHLSPTDIEAFGAELDQVRRDIEESRGAKDAAYIRRTILFQRTLDAAARVLIAGSRSRAGWWTGTAALAYAKCVENMELGHNISHGQWDWMNDPEIHSTTWEWDMVGPVVAVAVLAQLPAPRVQQCRRHGRRPRLRRHAGDPRSAVEARAPVPAATKYSVGSHFRMGYRAARLSTRSATGSTRTRRSPPRASCCSTRSPAKPARTTCCFPR